AVGIRVNAISPLAATDMAALDDRPDRPRLGSPEEVAPAVVALLSDATAGVTGRIIRFDGTTLSRYEPETLTVLAESPSLDRAETVWREAPETIARILTQPDS
ncbi:MAG: SDR family oxidoreductase, partial [Micromonosporaceae bacterium]|nr:SDR family oxidoreductase [Micromonosporaceae bacterium]